MRMLWENTITGDHSVWLMNGTSWGGSYALLPQVPTTWSIAGSGDFNADGEADVVWQNTSTGDRSIWFMTGTTWGGSYALLPNVPAEWSIAGVGDFNADGKQDLVWQNTTTGDRSIWFMNGSTWNGSYAPLPRVATEWDIAAVGDFNADGKPDLVWQNLSTGQRSIWFMNGSTWSGTYASLLTVPTAWRIAAAADFDGDGNTDLVWQHTTTGERSIWLMTGSTWNGSYASLPLVPSVWSIAGILPLAAAVGAVDNIAVQSGDQQVALAGTVVPVAIVVVPKDGAGHTILNQTPIFTVIGGNGVLSSGTGLTHADGSITAPTWTLGKSDVPQEIRVQIGGITKSVTASVRTSYRIAVRFFGAPPSAENQALFTSAAARIRAFIVGALPLVDATGADVSGCTGTSMPPLSEIIDGLVIYASVDAIDGPGNVLAQAGPCFIRSQGGVLDYRTVIGVMKFDVDDIGSLALGGHLQDVITHEMLHIVGLGVYWGPGDKNLLTGAGSPGAAYTGAGGIAGCRLVGGTVTCAVSLPVEDCVGLGSTPCGAGTLESHWKETTFGSELMTGYINSGRNPLSVMTIRSFEDLNYTSNPAAADAYTIAVGSLNAAVGLSSSPTTSPRWERPLPVAPRSLPTVGAN